MPRNLCLRAISAFSVPRTVICSEAQGHRKQNFIPPCPPPHRRAFHPVRPTSSPHADAPAPAPSHPPGLRTSLSLSYHTFLLKHTPFSSRPARDSSVSTTIPKPRAMLAQAVPRLRIRPPSVLWMRVPNCGIL